MKLTADRPRLALLLAAGPVILVAVAAAVVNVPPAAPAGPGPVLPPASSASERPGQQEPLNLHRSFALHGPPLHTAAAVLMDWESGTVLYSRHAHQRRDIASTTKIMTAVVALELRPLSDRVTVSRRAAATPGSSMGIRPGEVYTLEELLYGLLLPSGNDAAVAIAEHVGGSVAAFARLMNRKAAALGLDDTHFQNPHGLTARDHVSSAFDLALLTRYALTNPRFAAIVSQRQTRVCPQNSRRDADRRLRLRSTNRLLWTYPKAEGGKTGTTAAAGRCLVLAGRSHFQRLIAVVLRAGNRWQAARSLLEYGFNDFELHPVIEAGATAATVRLPQGRPRRLTLVAEHRLQVLLPAEKKHELDTVVTWDTHPPLPLTAGRRLGTLTAVVEGRVVGRTSLVAGRTVHSRRYWRSAFDWFLDGVSQGLLWGLY